MRITGLALAEMVDKDHCDLMLVRNTLEHTHVLVVAGVEISVARPAAHLLQRVDDNQVCVAVLGKEVLQLIAQAVRERLGEGSQMQLLRRLVC